MAKNQKTNPLIEDIDLEAESEKLELQGDDDDEMMDLSVEVAKPKPATGMDGFDLSGFIDGIVDVDGESEFIKALFYGPNGTGKNTVASTFPGPILVLDVNEHGTRSMMGSNNNIKKRSIDTFEMFAMAYFYLAGGNHPFKTVVIDNVTTLQELGLKFIMKKEAEFDLSKDMDMPNKRDWGGLSQLMKRWLIDFRNLPMNVVFIAQEKRTQEEDLESDVANVFPQVSGSVKAILGAAVDVIGRTYAIEADVDGKPTAKFYMRLKPNNTYMAKIRLPIGAESPSQILNPTYGALSKIMSGQYKPKSKVKKEETQNG